ncbi:MAG: CU044_2847 family protein [Archangium sp.]|nr:CU044_2847 family protein [Archangium sp.]MDP3574564.1 CU044_2847 family protein [Archangium sp.]
MAQFIEFESESGVVLVEVEEFRGENGYRRMSASGDAVQQGKQEGNASPGTDSVSKAAKSLKDSLSSVVPVVTGFMARVRDLGPEKPDEFELSFGLKLAGSAGVFAVAKISSEANYSVKFTWKKQTNQANADKT